MRATRLATMLAMALLLAGCSGEEAPHEPSNSETSSADEAPPPTPPGGFALTSSAVTYGKPIPEIHTGDGVDLSPPLAWRNPPDGVQSFALICEDPDSPGGTWVHWVLFNIPADTRSLPLGLPRMGRLPSPPGAVQGATSWPSGSPGYRGPAPPPGEPHRYFFRLHALDTTLELEPGIKADKLREAMAGHVLGTAELMGTYQRKPRQPAER